MASYILSIDQGTTGSTALVFDTQLKVLGKATVEFPQHFPNPGWVEHDLDEIWASVCQAVERAIEISRISVKQVAAIGVTNQRETTCVWSPETGRPAHPAIVWQDRRTADACLKLKKAGKEPWIRKKTGLCLDPYFSGTKLQWILKNVSGAATEAKKGKLVFGTIDSYLLFRLTGQHVTDISNASRTLLMDLKKGSWDEDLLKTFGIPQGMLPQILPSAVEYGRTKGFLNIPDGTPVTGVAGDQQAALFGQACFKQGMAKCTYGTGAFALVNTGSRPIASRSNLLTTVAWNLNGKTTYALEGSAFIAGAAVQWLRDGLKIISKSSDVEQLANTVSDSDGVLFVPALSGMGAPHWLPHATGLVTGITRRTQAGHIARATLEGIALQVGELLDAMAKDYGKKLAELRVDGGASENGLLMQFQSNLLGIPVVRCQTLETTALGAGLQAGLGIGVWASLDEISKAWKSDQIYKSLWSQTERKPVRNSWNKAIKALRELAKSP